MKRTLIALVLLLGFMGRQTLAQTPPVPGFASAIGAAASLSVTNGSGRVAIPSGAQVITVINDGANELFYKGGNSSVIATTADIPLPAGACWSMQVQGGAGVTNIAAITASSTTTLRVIGSNGGLNASCPSASVTATISGSVTLGSSQNNIGNVGGKTVEVCNTPTVTISNSYGTNYVVGGVLTFANAFTSTGSGLLQNVTVNIKDQENSGFTFIPFGAAPSGTGLTDAAVAALPAGDKFKPRQPIALTNNIQLAATAWSQQFATQAAQFIAPGTTSLSGILLANGALTNQFAGTSDVQVCVDIADDL